jgi:hypothetical protein
MTQQLKIFNLSFDTASHVSTDELLTSNDLEGDLLSSPLMNGQPHFSKGTLAQGAHNLVSADALLRLGLVSGGRLHGNLAATARLGGFGGIVSALMSVVVVVGLLLRRLLLLEATDMGGGQGDCELLVLEASSRCHGGAEGTN